MASIEGLKEQACATVDAWAGRLWETSLAIHDSPELGYQEHRAVKSLSALLAGAGIETECGVGSVETAFRAYAARGASRPAIAILAEYDALPKVGHGCGHNLIGTAAAGAGIAVASVAKDLPGSVMVVGCPAEESAVKNAGGKIKLVAAGAFDQVDCAIMVHPGTIDWVPLTGSLASCGMEFEFIGKAAHAAAMPQEGINALDAVIQTFVGINALRQHVRSDVRIHGIITHGGDSANIVPAHASCVFRVRSEDRHYLAQVVERVKACAQAGALATGARLVPPEVTPVYEEMKPNHVLAGLLERNLVSVGRKICVPEVLGKASSDLGNVSQKIPAICATVSMADFDVAIHSQEFAEAAASERGREMLVDSAKALAMTAIDLLCQPDYVAEAQREFTSGTR